MTPAQQIRDLVASDTVLMPGVYDALTARIAARVGFDIVFISGYSVSAAHLGEPDFGFLTQTEMAEAARSVCHPAPSSAGTASARLPRQESDSSPTPLLRFRVVLDAQSANSPATMTLGCGWATCSASRTRSRLEPTSSACAWGRARLPHAQWSCRRVG